jgi:protein AbiQ
MGTFRFYHIEENYIRYLRTIDPRVQYNKGEHRPYIGIVLSLNGMEYYVPLESPKPNHVNIKSGGPVLKLDDGKLGIMGFNNMIPVLPGSLLPFDILAIEDEKYKMLLLNQLRYCEKHRDVILTRAQSVYRKTVDKKIPFYAKDCCDFRKLERRCKNYDPHYQPRSNRKQRRRL